MEDGVGVKGNGVRVGSGWGMADVDMLRLLKGVEEGQGNGGKTGG